MSRLKALFRKEFLVLGRDWHGLLVLFVMPAVFILIMSLAMRDTLGEHQGVAIEYLLVNEAGDTLAQRFVDGLAQAEGFAAVPSELPHEDVVAQIAADRYKFALVVSAAFSERLLSGDAAAVEILVAPSATPQLRRLFSLACEAELMGLKVEGLLNASMAGMGGAEAFQSALDTVSIQERFLRKNGADAAIPSAVQQSVPAWLVFAMFFVVIPLSTAFIIERQQGSLVRLKIMDISPLALLTGKVVPYFFINQVQMVLMLLVGMHLVPLLGGDRLSMPSSIAGLAIISSATSLAAIGFALLVTTLAKTNVQATTMGGVSNIIFGALGGIMVPKFVMPDVMQQLTVVSPMSWGLEGFLDIFLRNGLWSDVLPEAAALMVLGVCTLLLAAGAFARNT
jgi:ABC-2 type transport system permease protein